MKLPQGKCSCPNPVVFGYVAEGDGVLRCGACDHEAVRGYDPSNVTPDAQTYTCSDGETWVVRCVTCSRIPTYSSRPYYGSPGSFECSNCSMVEGSIATMHRYEKLELAIKGRVGNAHSAMYRAQGMPPVSGSSATCFDDAERPVPSPAIKADDSEPDCHCDKPWNFGHDPSCAWKEWNERRKR